MGVESWFCELAGLVWLGAEALETFAAVAHGGRAG